MLLLLMGWGEAGPEEPITGVGMVETIYAETLRTATAEPIETVRAEKMRTTTWQ
jgi:hypothetical protein